MMIFPTLAPVKAVEAGSRTLSGDHVQAAALPRVRRSGAGRNGRTVAVQTSRLFSAANRWSIERSAPSAPATLRDAVHRPSLAALAPAAALVCVLSLAACASNPRGGPGGQGMRIQQTAEVAPEGLIFVEFDANRDRVVSAAELSAGLEADWTQASKGAASIGHIDLRAWLVSVLGSDEFDFGPVGFDTNLDSVITKAEFINALTQRFNGLDTDKNGAVSRAELVRQVQSLGRGPAGGRPGGGPQGGRPSGGGRGGGEGGPPPR